MRTALFTIDKVCIYCKELKTDRFSEIGCKFDEDIRKGDLAELDKVKKKMTSPPWEFSCHEYDGVRDFFWYKDQDVIGHITWIYYAGDPNKDIILGSKEAELKYGLTNEKYRGRKLLPATLVKIQKYLKANGYERVLTCVLEDNYPSLKSVDRAGFKMVKKKTSIKIFGIVLTRRYNHKKTFSY